jgi:formiminotetrahydrofolate cyclodeaminase
MVDFSQFQLSAFLNALASPDPTPGGGTASAVAGAMGTSLLIMVARLPKSRTGAEEEKAALSDAAANLQRLSERFMALANADSDAYNQVMAAYRLPKSTDEEQRTRKAAIQRAMTAATETPLEILRTAAEAISLARIVAQHGNRNAASDAGVGIGLLRAAADGAVANVRINIGSLEDEAFRSATERDLGELMRSAEHDAEAAKRALES